MLGGTPRPSARAHLAALIPQPRAVFLNPDWNIILACLEIVHTTTYRYCQKVPLGPIG